MRKLLGREPAAMVAVLEATLTLFLTFDAFDLTGDKVALIMAAVTAIGGLVTAWHTKDTLLGVLVGAVKAVIALSVGYGADLTDSQTTAIIAVTVAGLGLFQRTQTSPAVNPGFAEELPLPVPVTPVVQVVTNTLEGPVDLTTQLIDPHGDLTHGG